MLNDTQETTDTSETTVPEETAVETSTTEGDTKAKAEETPEAKYARLKRQLEQHEKKHKLGSHAEKQPEGDSNQASDPNELDYGQLAFLASQGVDVNSEKQLELVRKSMKETGKDLKGLLSSKYFQAELKELKDEAAATDAIPQKGGRAGGAARNSVEYWVAKGELPPNTPENQQLRRDVVNAKTKAAQSGSQFSSTPVVQ